MVITTHAAVEDHQIPRMMAVVVEVVDAAHPQVDAAHHPTNPPTHP
jgi:hypothetical protein